MKESKREREREREKVSIYETSTWKERERNEKKEEKVNEKAIKSPMWPLCDCVYACEIEKERE